MSRRGRDQSMGIGAIVLVLFLVACARPEPKATVQELNWACGASRCTATFRITGGPSGDETLLVLVRAYSGDSAASRKIVGEHRERVVLSAGQSKRMSAAIDTPRPATKLRVILKRAD